MEEEPDKDQWRYWGMSAGERAYWRAFERRQRLACVLTSLIVGGMLVGLAVVAGVVAWGLYELMVYLVGMI